MAAEEGAVGILDGNRCETDIASTSDVKSRGTPRQPQEPSGSANARRSRRNLVRSQARDPVKGKSKDVLLPVSVAGEDVAAAPLDAPADATAAPLSSAASPAAQDGVVNSGETPKESPISFQQKQAIVLDPHRELATALRVSSKSAQEMVACLPPSMHPMIIELQRELRQRGRLYLADQERMVAEVFMRMSTPDKRPFCTVDVGVSDTDTSTQASGCLSSLESGRSVHGQTPLAGDCGSGGDSSGIIAAAKKRTDKGVDVKEREGAVGGSSELPIHTHLADVDIDIEHSGHVGKYSGHAVRVPTIEEAKLMLALAEAQRPDSCNGPEDRKEFRKDNSADERGNFAACPISKDVEPDVIKLNFRTTSRNNVWTKGPDFMSRPSRAERIKNQAKTLKWGGRCLSYLADCLSWFESLEEPPRHGVLARVVDSITFGCICAIFIGLNAAFIAYTTNYEMSHIGESHSDLIVHAELVFNLWFLLEMVFKVIVHRLYLFCGQDALWNWFDFMLVAFSAFEGLSALTAQASGASVSFVNVGYLRSLRIFKLAKALRIVRALRFFNDLRVMLDCVVGSLLSLFWCLVLLTFILYIFALMIMQGLSDALASGNITADESDDVKAMFGSVATSMFTLLQSTTGGMDWNDVIVRLRGAGSWVTLTFLFYILFFAIAAWNVITSTFIDRALKLTKPDNETMMLEERMQSAIDAEMLLQLFNEIDADGSKCLSLDEFEKLTEHPKFRAFLHAHNIDISDAEMIYKMLVAGLPCSELDSRTFVNALLRMKGPASSIDLHSLNFETHLLNTTQQMCWDEALMSIRELQKQMQEIKASVWNAQWMRLRP